MRISPVTHRTAVPPATGNKLVQIAREYLLSTTFAKLDEHIVPRKDWGRPPTWLQKAATEDEDVSVHELRMAGQTIYGISADEGNVVQIVLHTAAGNPLVVGTTYTDIGLIPNTTYSYTVAAQDAAGNIACDARAAGEWSGWC